ncbi:MAG: hypothetical protein ACHQ03_06305 [Candidatus Bathyarchaeia archaeon]
MNSLRRYRWSGLGIVMIALGFSILMFGLLYHPSQTSTASENTCIGVRASPCEYSGPFTGTYYTGYATFGCNPISASESCFVPQIAVMTSYLSINNSSYVIDWANRTFQGNNQLTDGSIISVSGGLTPIFYNKTVGATFMVYRSNAGTMVNPQPEFEIQNATLTQSPNSTCTTTLTFTVSGPSNGVWNLPMIPAGACYTVVNVSQQSSNANVGSIQTNLLASNVGGLILITLGLLFMKRSRSKKTTHSS